MADPVEQAEQVEDQEVSDSGQTQSDVSREDLAESVTEKMDALFGDEGPSATATIDGTPEDDTADPQKVVTEDADEDADATVDDDVTEDSDVDADESDSADDDAGESEAAEDEPSSTLPARYRRSLKARGWDDEEIDNALAVNSEAAMRTFDRIHSSRTEEITRFAALGRKVRDTERAAAEAVTATGPADARTATQAQTAPSQIDEDALIEQYGPAHADVIKALVGPIQERLAEIDRVLPEFRDSAAVMRQTNQEALAEMLRLFFTAPDMGPYVEFYGADGVDLTDDQKSNRWKVAESADAQIVGAAEQGRKLADHEALMDAHDVVSSKFQAKAIRKGLKKVVKKRNSGITQKPTKKKAPDASAGSRTRAEFEHNTKQLLAKALGN